jgi:(p)ppGpp synthase/HD superfamily hydrolase
MDVVERARVFATAAHAAVRQFRKYTGEPYIVHPREVAGLVAAAPNATPAMIAAAWMHDVLEDTGVTEAEMREEFGDEVTDLVVWLTDVETGNRATRKRLAVERMSRAPVAAKTVKLADLVSNTSTIVKYDPNFAPTYLREKREMLEVLTDGDAALFARASENIGASA